MGKGDHSGRRPEPDASSVPRRHAARASIRAAVYTSIASAAVSLVDASGVVTPAIMACRTLSTLEAVAEPYAASSGVATAELYAEAA